MILERNYLDVYPYERWADRDIPNFENGDQYQPQSLEVGFISKLVICMELYKEKGVYIQFRS